MNLMITHNGAALASLVGEALFWMYVLWVCYAAITNIKRVRDLDRMTPVMRWMSYPLLAVGYPLDIAVGLVASVVLFWSGPRFERREFAGLNWKQAISRAAGYIGDLTFSALCSYHYEPKSTAWRSRLAWWFERNLLGALDPSGRHID